MITPLFTNQNNVLTNNDHFFISYQARFLQVVLDTCNCVCVLVYVALSPNLP